MVVGAGAVRAVFVGGFVCWYSTGIFKAMDNHFGNHFGEYLKEQLRDNEHMRHDLEEEREAMARVLEAKGKSLPQRDADASHRKEVDRVRGESLVHQVPEAPGIFKSNAPPQLVPEDGSLRQTPPYTTAPAASTSELPPDVPREPRHDEGDIRWRQSTPTRGAREGKLQRSSTGGWHRVEAANARGPERVTPGTPDSPLPRPDWAEQEEQVVWRDTLSRCVSWSPYSYAVLTAQCDVDDTLSWWG